MSDKPGCGVFVSLDVTDENGQSISHTDSKWLGFPRGQANAMAMDITDAITAICEKYNVAQFGSDYRGSTPPKK